MEGAPYIPPNRPKRRPDQVCAECARAFRPRHVGDGPEELSDNCYEAQFEPRHLRHWQKLGGRTHPPH